MVTNNEIRSKVRLIFLGYQLRFPDECEDVLECGKMLDKILDWDDKTIY